MSRVKARHEIQLYDGSRGGRASNRRVGTGDESNSMIVSAVAGPEIVELGIGKTRISVLEDFLFPARFQLYDFTPSYPGNDRRVGICARFQLYDFTLSYPRGHRRVGFP